MVRDGIYYGIGLAAGGVFLSALLSPAYGAPLFVLAIFCLYFFRDPDRVAPSGQVAVSPADGKVVAIRHDTPETTQISIFLNIFDVHVNRSPIAGKISQVVYHHGRFMPANRAAASSRNEQNVVTIDAGDTTVKFAQIAGLIARRIVFYKQTGDDVGIGERVGLIKFGSRVDVFFGPEWEIAVQKGTRVSAGTSVLAKRK
ncbi:MAG: phosphatidylserine decarboxylase [Bryobacteraceae bacterium]|jgi:phosphatidylserine decarboxylase